MHSVAITPIQIFGKMMIFISRYIIGTQRFYFDASLNIFLVKCKRKIFFFCRLPNCRLNHSKSIIVFFLPPTSYCLQNILLCPNSYSLLGPNCLPFYVHDAVEPSLLHGMLPTFLSNKSNHFCPGPANGCFCGLSLPLHNHSCIRMYAMFL